MNKTKKHSIDIVIRLTLLLVDPRYHMSIWLQTVVNIKNKFIACKVKLQNDIL